MLLEPFSISTHVGDSTVSRFLVPYCSSSDLEEVDMLDYDIFWVFYLIQYSYDSIYCKTRVVKFEFVNDLIP